MNSPRIALLGFAIESNRFAPVSQREDFLSRAYLEADVLLADARHPTPRITPEIPAFVNYMDSVGPWRPVPILFANAESGGPVAHDFFVATLKAMESRLRAALPLDAVYICEHGAAITTEIEDPDGEVFEMVRQVVGPHIPIVATIDLHANVSDRMVDHVEVLIAYRRNPHTDMADRGREAGQVLSRLLLGLRPTVAHVRMPVCSPPTQLLTARGTGAYADMIQAAEAMRDPRLVNISVVGGFAYGDTTKNGLTVIVTTDNDAAFAETVAYDLAMLGWERRAAFTPTLTPLTQAVAMAQAAGSDPRLPAVLLADVADNPGGGGRGNTPDLLIALLAAKVKDVVLGVFTDPAVCEAAHRHGVGAQFEAVFNSTESTLYSTSFKAHVSVLQLHNGKGVGRRGQLAGCNFDLGPSALLQIDGIKMVVITERHQCHEPAFLESFGVDLAQVRTLVVKSRGHFRAAFDEYFAPEQIISVDAPGLTSPILSRFDFQRLPRPSIPLDPVEYWQPAVRLLNKMAFKPVP